MTWYYFKRAILMPYIVYKRRQNRDKSVFMRKAMDLHYYRPTFFHFMRATIRNPDIMYEAPLDEGDIALDVGGYQGQWAERVYEKYKPHVYVFEPDPPSFRNLSKRFEDNPDIECFPYGLGASDMELDLIQKGMGSSFYGAGEGPESKTVKVQLRDVAGVLEELGHDDVHVIKLNIEGGEYDVLERLIETGWVPRVRCFLIQFHEWFKRAHSRRRRIQAALRKSHDVEWDYPFIWEKWVRR